MCQNVKKNKFPTKLFKTFFIAAKFFLSMQYL